MELEGSRPSPPPLTIPPNLFYNFNKGGLNGSDHAESKSKPKLIKINGMRYQKVKIQIDQSPEWTVRSTEMRGALPHLLLPLIILDGDTSRGSCRSICQASPIKSSASVVRGGGDQRPLFHPPMLSKSFLNAFFSSSFLISVDTSNLI